MRFFRDLAIALASAVFCIALIEAGMHIAGVQFPPLSLGPDSSRSFGFRPGMEGVLSGEGETYARINSKGYRDKEHTLARSDDTIRIAILGDSTVAGLQVPLENTFGQVVERTLNQCNCLKGRKVEVLNFGVNNYSLAQNYLTLKEDVWKYDPQIVMVAVSVVNAIFNSTRDLTISGVDYPYYTYQNGRLEPDTITRAQKPLSADDIRWYRRLLNFEDHLDLFRLYTQAFPKVYSWKTTATRMLGSRFPSNYAKVWTFQPPKNKAMETAWQVSEGMLGLMQQDTEKHGAEFWVLTLSAPNQVNPDVKARQAWLHDIGYQSLFYPDARLADWARRAGAKSAMLAPQMAEYATARNLPLHGFANTAMNTGHLNRNGHEIAGKLIASKLCSESEKLSCKGDAGGVNILSSVSFH